MTTRSEHFFEVHPMTHVPEHLRGGLRRYVLHGISPGKFLCAVLEHELFAAYNRADLETRAGLYGLVAYIQNHLPADCHGSEDTVTRWIERGGLIGREKEPAL